MLDYFAPQCAAFNGLLGYYGGRAPGLVEGGFWINHYAFQSAEHWEKKKARGRTNAAAPREGGIPPFFSTVVDDEGRTAFTRRVHSIAGSALRSCLLRTFQLA